MGQGPVPGSARFMYYQDPIGFQVAGLSVGASAWVDALWEFDILAGIEKV